MLFVLFFKKLSCTSNSLTINNGVNIYEQVFLFTYLGVTQDPCLQWKLYKTKVIKQLSAGLGAISRTKVLPES